MSRVPARAARSCLAAGLLAAFAVPAVAEGPQPKVVASASLRLPSFGQTPPPPSRDCGVRTSTFAGHSPLRSMRKALRENRPIKVLAIGSSSTVGVGASSPMMGYTVRLENDLEVLLGNGVDINLIPRGMSGEMAEGTANRIRTEVTENRPDLVVWQVGTNDAMARVGEDKFTQCLHSTLQWLQKQRVDVILVNPQYVEALARDDYYRRIVEIIADVARAERVLVVDRYQAMAELSQRNGNNTYLAADRFHLNDLGYRCMAEQSARAIVAGILQADADQALQAPQQVEPAEPESAGASQTASSN